MVGTVYILQSLKNNSYYIGTTDDLRRRMKEHSLGKSKYTSEILPVKLVFSQKYQSIVTARKVESWLKRLKNKELIKSIISDRVIKKSFE